MQVNINGNEQSIDAGQTVADLIAGYQLQPKHVAVEINCDLVPRAQFGETAINEGDRIEIVTLVGGG
jgi:thiamine biosynthesis protein ThiS